MWAMGDTYSRDNEGIPAVLKTSRWRRILNQAGPALGVAALGLLAVVLAVVVPGVYYHA